ncbi:MAG TPA: saccharopine dehydrogenase NADP-binding domain-containing protein [Nocardioidaceae bacterium]|nr:saccharopine dehydrogenase NADP-binding domain-containing protein [Nocardioidaceae bacterium]
MDKASRDFDIVLFGATGFTGRLVAEYLARTMPPGARWALAGRSQERLEEVRDRLAGRLQDGAPGGAPDRLPGGAPNRGDLPLLHADVTDPASLDRVAQRARVVVSTVGPYLTYGEPLVAACAAAGTDYADLTGEPEFVDRMYVGYHRQAVESGARLVHACGFDSVPHDLGARFTVLQLPQAAPIRVRGMVRAQGALSAGTLSTAVTAMSRARQMRQAAAERRAREPRPAGRRVRSVARGPHRDPDTGLWLMPLPTIDPLVVKRSAAALDRYGPDFGYAHYAALRRLPVMAATAAGLGGLAAAVQLPPVRDAVLSRIRQGDGPSESKRARSWFCVRFVGEADGRRVVTEVTGGDPGYGETATMLGESALSLAFDDNPEVAGQLTTAVAMGENLTGRLQRAGMGFDVLDRSDRG